MPLVKELAFFENLETRSQEIGSLLCVGLDPHPEEVRRPGATAARDYCLKLIEATSSQALAYKPNPAFFEAYGPQGWQALSEVIQTIPPNIPVLVDAKRGDIASSAEAYGRALFDGLGANAITVSPYLGGDSLTPFLANPARGVFMLCKTSNPGSADLQDRLLADGQTLYEVVAKMALELNHPENLGLVVGATFPEALRRVRQIAPDIWMLSPGIGAQGGNLVDAVRAAIRPDGMGIMLPVSRAISLSDNPGETARSLNASIREVVKQNTPPPVRTAGVIGNATPLARALLDSGCVRFGSFTLKSGLTSPIYIDLRQMASHPRMLAHASVEYEKLLTGLECDRLAGLPYAAVPIATALSLRSGIPMIYPRKEAKDYGTKAEIEGDYIEGETAVIIDDLATTGGSKFEAIKKLTDAGLKVKDVIVLIDRQSGAKQSLEEAGYTLHAVFTLSQLLDEWEASGAVPSEQIAATRAFLEETCTSK